MKATLFVIPGSHPSMAARLMLERKGIEYRRIDLIPVISKAVVRMQRFPGVTVPALKLDGRRIQGTKEIALALDELRPDQPLLPADPDHRKRVEEVDHWVDGELQSLARATLWWALRRDRAPMATFTEGARLGVPTGLAVKTAAPIVALAARLNEATDENVRAGLAKLPGALERIDDLIADGTIGGPEPNLADYQVATSVRLLLAFEDLRPLIEGRPVGEHAKRVVPEYPGRVPQGALPADWVARPFAQRTS